jgi:hypothetical protein
VNAGQLVIAHHGCDITLRDDLVSGRVSHLEHSKNKYDWLGSGALWRDGCNVLEGSRQRVQVINLHLSK